MSRTRAKQSPIHPIVKATPYALSTLHGYPANRSNRASLLIRCFEVCPISLWSLPFSSSAYKLYSRLPTSPSLYSSAAARGAVVLFFRTGGPGKEGGKTEKEKKREKESIKK